MLDSNIQHPLTVGGYV